MKYKGHWVCCLGCQQSMATHTIIYNLEHNVTNTFICSSVGGEYAAMSMPVTRDMNIVFYKRYGIRYNAPLLDLGINKNEERRIMKEHNIEPDGANGVLTKDFNQSVLLGSNTLWIFCSTGIRLTRQIGLNSFLDDKASIMDTIIRRELMTEDMIPTSLSPKISKCTIVRKHAFKRNVRNTDKQWPTEQP